MDETITLPYFPNVEALGPLASDAADKLRDAYEQLTKAGAQETAHRLLGIDRFVGEVEFTTLQRIVDPQRAVSELIEVRQRRVRWIRMLRNAVAGVAALFTLLTLSVAAKFYQDELAVHPVERTSSFILLWEQRFGGRFIPTFTETVLIDILFLIFIGILSVLTYKAISSALHVKARATESLYAGMGALEMAVEQSAIRPPASAEDWANAAKRIITDAMEETKLLAAAGHEATEKYSTEISRTLMVVREENERFISRTARETRETLQRLVEQQMDPLLGQLSAMIATFSMHQKTYRDGVADLAQGMTSVSASLQALAGDAQILPHAMLAELARSQGELLRSQRDLHGDITELIEWLRSTRGSLSPDSSSASTDAHSESRIGADAEGQVGNASLEPHGSGEQGSEVPGFTSGNPDSAASRLTDLWAVPITIYISAEEIHQQVEESVEVLLADAGLRIESRDDPVEGSWFRRMKAALNTPAAREGALVAAHIADTHLVLGPDATVTATLMHGIGPVLTSLQPTKDAVVRLGAVLIVKVDWVVSVNQLTAAQQALLDHRPELAAAPDEIIKALQLPSPGGIDDGAAFL